MKSKTLIKHFNAFLGIDVSNSDLTRNLDAASELQNAVYTRDRSIVNRPGCKILAPNGPYLGMYSHTYTSPTTGELLEETLAIGQKLYRRKTSTFTVSYSGSASQCTVSFRFTEENVFKCILVEAGIEVAAINLGNGLESVPVDLTSLIASIAGVAGFSASTTATASNPAALVLPIVVDLDLASSPKTQVITSYEWQAVNETTTNVFATYFANRGAEQFEHASMVNAENSAVFATGYEYLQKYDGQTVFRLGLPEPAAPTLALGAAGNPNGTYQYIATYVQVDNRGNRFEGTESIFSGTISPASQQVTVTVPNVVAGTGFNTNCALVNGAQVGVNTITVTNTPHTMKVGDTAYFLDRSSGAYVTRSVTAVTATTITVSGAVVNVNNADVISNNLRIAIYRNKAGGIDPYLVAEIPNNSFAATQNYSDNKADTSITVQYRFAPDGRDHDLLTAKPRYVAVHQSQLIAAGDFANPDSVFISQPFEIQAFSADGGIFDIVSTQSGGISGLGSDGTSLIVGKDMALYAGSGDFSTPGAFRFEKINEGNVGFACHNTIQDVGDGLIFLSRNGWYLLRGGSELIEIGERINKFITDRAYSAGQTYQLKRAFAVSLDRDDLYICYVPCESGSGTGRFANSNSRVFVYDKFLEGWMTWKGVNMAGGLAVSDNELWWQSKRDDSALTVTGNLFKQSNTGTIYDYADHGVPIEWKFFPQWEDGGEPSVFKLFTRLRIYSVLREVLQPNYSMNVRTEINYTPGLTHSRFVAGFGVNGSSGYGYGAWGSSAWGSPIIATQKYKLKVTKLNSIRFCFEHNTLHERVALSGWEYEMATPYKREMK